VYRFCHLITNPGQSYGFRTEFDNDKHIIRGVKLDSPAGKMSNLFSFEFQCFLLFRKSWFN
jgi:hypothetical protein